MRNPKKHTIGFRRTRGRAGCEECNGSGRKVVKRLVGGVEYEASDVCSCVVQGEPVKVEAKKKEKQARLF